MNNKSEIVKLTSAEISALWDTYMNVSVVTCFMTHFLETCSDPDIRNILEDTKHFADKHQNKLEQLFLKEKMVVPEAFKPEKHVIPNAPKLFSDIFYMQAVLQMCKFGIASHTASFTISAREDIRTMFKELIDDVAHLNNTVVGSMQEKGIYVRMPFMNYPTEIDYIDKEKFLTGWFGRRRSLLAIEVTHLMINAIHNEMGNAICTGFSQVTKDQEIRDYFLRGKQLCKHNSGSIHDVLEENDIPAAITWDHPVTDSTEAPFSEQFMLFIIGALSELGIASYGAGLSFAMRRDITAMYANFITKTGTFGEDGLNLMIERKWIEQPPQIGAAKKE